MPALEVASEATESMKIQTRLADLERELAERRFQLASLTNIGQMLLDFHTTTPKDFTERHGALLLSERLLLEKLASALNRLPTPGLPLP